jgi:hypothetical protein
VAVLADRSTNRIVEDVGSDVPDNPGLPIGSDVVLTAAAGRLFGSSKIFYFDAGEFGTDSFGVPVSRPGFLLQGTGRFADAAKGWFNFRATPQRIDVEVWVAAPTGGYFFAEGTAVPSSRRVTDANCASGVRLETQATFTLEHLGRTLVEERHCAPQ